MNPDQAMDQVRPAFPTPTPPVDQGGVEHGLAMRDYFAAAALTGLLANPQLTSAMGNEKTAAELAYNLADQMLDARVLKDASDQLDGPASPVDMSDLHK